MSFLFATSHLPAVKRPQDAEDEEDEDNAQPMQRSGGVRAISHLEEADSAPETLSPTSDRISGSAPPARALSTPSQTAAQPVERSLFMTPRPPHPQYFAQAQAIRAGTNRLLPLETTATDVTPGQTTTPTIRNLQQRNNDAPTAKLLAQATPNKASATQSSSPTPGPGRSLTPPTQRSSATLQNAGIAQQIADSASSPKANSESKIENEQGAVKSEALFQKNKTINSSTIPKSQRGLAVLKEFFNPEARSIDELNDSMRKALAGDKALILHVNSNGEHSAIIAIHLDKNGNLVNTLYDPAGTYTGIQNRKGSDDVLTNELPTNGSQNVDWSLADYINYHASDGSMSFVPIWTDGETARNLNYTPNSMMGFCALSSRNVIQQIPGFTKSWGFRPVTPNDLSDQLHRLMGRKVAIQHKP